MEISYATAAAWSGAELGEDSVLLSGDKFGGEISVGSMSSGDIEGEEALRVEGCLAGCLSFRAFPLVILLEEVM